MRLTTKLIGFLNRVFNKDPQPFLAMRLSYDGDMQWSVSEGFLTTTVTGMAGSNLSVDLSQYTLGSLAAFLLGQPSYNILYLDNSILAGLSALTLLDGAADIADSNGDHLYAYQNPLYSFYEASSGELEAAQEQVALAPLELSTVTADGFWLDELGSYYAVPRFAGEADAQYGPRIIAEVLRPKGNNVAIEMAIQTYTGQVVTVTDVVTYGAPSIAYNGAITHNGSHDYNATASAPRYGLFDVSVGYDLLSGDPPTAFLTTITGIIGVLRDAGTQLRALSLSGGVLGDTFTAPTDAIGSWRLISTIADSLVAPTDAFVVGNGIVFVDSFTAPTDGGGTLSIVETTTYNGGRRFDGSRTFSSGLTLSESLDGQTVYGAS